MAAPVSVIIPTLNAAHSLPATVQSLMPALSAGLIHEVILSDGGSADATLEIADELGARLVTGAASRGAQLARGCAAARGDWLLVLHADTHLAGDWVDAVHSHIASAHEMAGFFQLRFRATGFWPMWVAAWANWRSRALGLPYGDQGLLISRTLYHRIGGYADVPLMEDVAMARTLRGRMVPLAGEAHTSAVRFQKDGWARRGLRNLWLLVRYLMGARPERLVRAYTSSKK